MSTPAQLRVVNVHPDRADKQVGTVRLVNGQLEFSDPDLDVLVRRWRVSGIPDTQTYAELAQGGWSNGAVAIKP